MAKNEARKPEQREVIIPIEKLKSAKDEMPESLTEIQSALELKKPEVKGARFTMSARGVHIKNVLFALSQEIDQNIIIDPSVDKPGVDKLATVDLKNVTLEEALESLLPPLRLKYEIDDKYIRVGRQEMQTRTFYLNYVISKRVGSSSLSASSGAGASTSNSSESTSSSSSGGTSGNRPSTSIESSEETDLWSQIQEGLSAIVSPSSSTTKATSDATDEKSSAANDESSPGGDSSGLISSLLGGAGPSSSVEGATGKSEEEPTPSTENQSFVERGFLVVNRQAGMVVVKDYPDVLLQVAEFLEQVEGSVQRQVFIQAKIVEITLNDNYQLGVDWAAVSPFTLNHFGGSSLQNTTILGTTGFGYGLADGAFNIVVDALSKQGQVNVLSSPKITTLNNQRAVIKVGTEDIFFLPEITPATTTTPARTDFLVNTVTIGIVLDVVPQINPNGQIMMSINTSITERIGDRTSPDGTVIVPIIDVRESNNVVLAQHGQTIIIGGLMKTKKEVDDNSIPLLGALPYVGRLFHWDQENTDKTELVIMLTPEIMAGKAVDDRYVLERDSLRNSGYDIKSDSIVNPSFKR